MGLVDWLSDSLLSPVVRDEPDEPRVFAIGLCPFTGSHWLIEERPTVPGADPAAMTPSG